MTNPFISVFFRDDHHEPHHEPHHDEPHHDTHHEHKDDPHHEEDHHKDHPKDEDERPPPAASKPKAASIFGQAKPVDTTAREREIEERLKKKSTEERPEVENGERLVFTLILLKNVRK